MYPVWIVILLGDMGVAGGGDKQEYYLATRLAFATREAAERYAAACAESRKPIVVECSRGVDFRFQEF